MNTSLQNLADAVVNLDRKGIEPQTRQALEAGAAPLEVIGALARGMETIGGQFKCGEVFLPEVMVACDVYRAGFQVVFPLLQASANKTFAGCIVMGSIYGDVHTVGKDVASAVFAAAGFRVVDLGVTVKDDVWLQAVREHRPDILGLGTYMTSTFMHTKELVRQLAAAGLRDQLKVICGGPSVNPEAARTLGADGASSNAWEAVEIMRSWVRK